MEEVPDPAAAPSVTPFERRVIDIEFEADGELSAAIRRTLCDFTRTVSTFSGAEG